MVGLYQNCLATNECDPELTDGCFTVTNERLQVVDGYCTLICADVVECEQASDVSGMQACVLINNVKMCALPCRDDLVCPSGMFCKELAGSGYYCI